MNERVSALMDGELEEGAAAAEAGMMRTNGELRDTWNTYHLIGDALRGDLYPSLQGKVAVRLAAEPTVLAPQPRRTSPAWRAARYALSAAAGLGGVALVVWTAAPVGGPLPQVQMAQPASAPPARAVEPKNVETYLFAHQRYSPAMAGAQAILVSEERGAVAR